MSRYIKISLVIIPSMSSSVSCGVVMTQPYLLKSIIAFQDRKIKELEEILQIMLRTFGHR